MEFFVFALGLVDFLNGFDEFEGVWLHLRLLDHELRSVSMSFEDWVLPEDLHQVLDLVFVCEGQPLIIQTVYDVLVETDFAELSQILIIWIGFPVAQAIDDANEFLLPLILDFITHFVVRIVFNSWPWLRQRLKQILEVLIGHFFFSLALLEVSSSFYILDLIHLYFLI